MLAWLYAGWRFGYLYDSMVLQADVVFLFLRSFASKI
jgi:hypothetical protein